MSFHTTIHQNEFENHPLLTRLLQLHNIPLQINVHGELPEVTLDEYGRATPRILTIVGSRKNTTYGKQSLEKLIQSLSGYDVVIVSGLAYGIDSLAHKLSLTHNLRTIAIPGSGLSEKVLYPSAHRELAKDITGYGGALISELPHDAPAAPWTFLQRNRIMAALSDAVLIVEAEEKSGTLVTARLALELGKDIGAIPGEIFSPTSSGTNSLIKEGAYMITSKEDILALLHLDEVQPTKDGTQELEESSHTKEELVILNVLHEPLDKDTLLEKTGLSFEDFMTAFSSLEIQGRIEELFGEVRRLV